jgi:hypothetical protein
MAYHQKYNEKGFQEVGGLPKKLKLKLYDAHFMSYDFEKPYLNQENCCAFSKKCLYRIMPKLLEKAQKSKRKIVKSTFKYIYQEDPYHIGVIVKSRSEAAVIRKVLDSLQLKEINYADFGVYELAVDGEEGCLVENLLALRFKASQVLVLEKKDGTKFSRFNSKEIKGLRARKFVVACLTNRFLEYYGLTDFEPSLFFNKSSPYPTLMLDFNSNREIEQVFCSTLVEDHKMFNGNVEPNLSTTGLPSMDADRVYSVFFVISNIANDSTGFGILDNMCLTEKASADYIFTNKYLIPKTKQK